jgi:hypothetical protein
MIQYSRLVRLFLLARCAALPHKTSTQNKKKGKKATENDYIMMFDQRNNSHAIRT